MYDAPATTTHSPGPSPDLGSGQRFGADVYELYEAGQVAFPELAAAYGQAASQLHYVTFLLQGIAGRLDHVGAWGVASQAEQVYDAAAATSRRLHLTGEALVQLADDFRRTDESAAEAFHHLVIEHRDLLSSAPAWLPPPRPDDLPDFCPQDLPDEAGLGALLQAAGIPPLIPGADGGDDADPARPGG